MQNLVTLVFERNDEALEHELMRLPFDTLDEYAIYDLLGLLLDAATKVQSASTAKLLLRVWGDTNPTEERISTLAMCFLKMQIPRNVLRGVVILLSSEVSYDEIATELMNYEDAPLLTAAAERLDAAFGGRTYEQADFLRKWARNANCSTLERYYRDVAGAQSVFAPVPEWVIPPKGDELRTHDELVASLKPIELSEQEAEFYTQDIQIFAHDLLRGMREQGFAVNEDQEEDAAIAVMQLINTSLPAERAALLEQFSRHAENQKKLGKRLDAGQNDVEQFRVLGPVNILTGAHADADDECMRWGGCRMLTCNMFERDETRAGLSYSASDGGTDIDHENEANYGADWFFLARCHRCERRIRSRAHALRQPLPYGGWRGCFCSYECTREAMAEDGSWNNITAQLLRRVVEQLKSTGITDRAPDPRPYWEKEEVERRLIEEEAEEEAPRGRVSLVPREGEIDSFLAMSEEEQIALLSGDAAW